MTKYGLKNRTRISNAVDTSLYERLSEHSKITGIPISKALDRSIAMYLKSVEKKAARE
jgi:hypothetical protein